MSAVRAARRVCDAYSGVTSRNTAGMRVSKVIEYFVRRHDAADPVRVLYQKEPCIQGSSEELRITAMLRRNDRHDLTYVEVLACFDENIIKFSACKEDSGWNLMKTGYPRNDATLN
jgi:hypothetical protein